MLSFEQYKLLAFLTDQEKETKFADIFPWAAGKGIEHPDIVARELVDLGLIKANYRNGVYRVL